MYFEYTDSFYVNDADFEEMIRMIKKGFTPQEAIDDWGAGLDDCDYYRVGNIEEELKIELEKRAGI